MNPTGPHPVGVADVAATCVTPGVDRLAARLFYPCARCWTPPCTWIPHFNYARGYVGYLFKLVKKKTIKTELTKAALISAAWAIGSSRILPVYYNAQLAPCDSSPALLPVVVFSHGLAGNRNTYSSICIELASQGYVVMAVEHGDGSASAARLPQPATAVTATATTTAAAAASTAAGNMDRLRHGDGGSNRSPSNGNASGRNEDGGGGDNPGVRNGVKGGSGSEWMFYGGLGDGAEQVRKTRQRVAEVEAAVRLLGWLSAGQPPPSSSSSSSSACSPHLSLRELPAALAASLRGRLDLSRAAVAGHSYGGATAAAAAALLDCFRAAVCLDPWWDCFAPHWPVLTRWVNPHRPPLLVVGSEDWNTPNAQGRLKCGGANQERVLAAASGAPPVDIPPAAAAADTSATPGSNNNSTASVAGSKGSDGGGSGGGGGGGSSSGGGGGGGAVFVVPSGSTHGNFDDVMLLFGKSLSVLLRLFNIRSSLEPRRAHRINTWCITHFLGLHLPPPPSSPSAAASSAPPSPTLAATNADGGVNPASKHSGRARQASCTAAAAAARAPAAAAAVAVAVAVAGGAAHAREGGAGCEGGHGCNGGAVQATTTASTAAAAPGGGGGSNSSGEDCSNDNCGSSTVRASGPKPVLAEDEEPYRRQLGQWASMLRVYPAAGVE